MKRKVKNKNKKHFLQLLAKVEGISRTAPAATTAKARPKNHSFGNAPTQAGPTGGTRHPGSASFRDAPRPFPFRFPFIKPNDVVRSVTASSTPIHTDHRSSAPVSVPRTSTCLSSRSLAGEPCQDTIRRSIGRIRQKKNKKNKKKLGMGGKKKRTSLVEDFSLPPSGHHTSSTLCSIPPPP